MTIKEKARLYFEDTVAQREDFHRNPELSDSIVRTKKQVTQKLAEWGIPYYELPGGAVIGEIDSGKPGKTVALRADMDALPIVEVSSQPYCSTVHGAGHLCGHDCHTASLMTAARILNEEKENFSGKVVLLFQAAEEAPGGCDAQQIIDAGALDGADAVFGVHMYNNIDVGTVSVQPGARMAASLRGSIVVHGVGAHGGSPHLGVDAVLVGSAIVMNLQSIASRELNIQDDAVITVGMFNAGTSPFAIAEEATLRLCIKFFNAELADTIRESVTRIAKSTAAAFRADCDVTIEGFLDPVVNDPALSAIATESLRTLGGDKAIAVCPAWCASEDFGKYEKKAPGVFAFVGGRNKEKGMIYTAHHPSFDVDEESLYYASGIYAQFAFDYLNQ